jgi:hypothetical protein
VILAPYIIEPWYSGLKSEALSLKEKQWTLPVFEFFVRNKIDLGIGSIIMRLAHIYLTVSRQYIKST